MELEKQTMTLDEQIARLRELDKERTQGEWRVSDYSRCPIETVDGQSIIEACEGTVYSEYSADGAYTDIAVQDALFIAAAPTMMEIITTLQHHLQIAEGALKRYLVFIKNNRPTLMDCIMQTQLDMQELSLYEALAQIRGEK